MICDISKTQIIFKLLSFVEGNVLLMLEEKKLTVVMQKQIVGLDSFSFG